LITADSEPQSITMKDALKNKESAQLAHDAARLVRASRRVFVDRAESAAQRRTLPRRAPTVYRDSTTRLIRCLYREIVVRFKTKVPTPRRRAHLSDMRLEFVRLGTASPHHFVVRDPRDERQGDSLNSQTNSVNMAYSDLHLKAVALEKLHPAPESQKDFAPILAPGLILGGLKTASDTSECSGQTPRLPTIASPLTTLL